MSDIRQTCTACDGKGHLMISDGWGKYKPHPKLPCTVCKGYGYMLPVSNEPPPIQNDAFALSES